MDLDKIKKNFDDCGYVTIKNFLNDQEINKLRSFMIEYEQTKNDKNDFILKTEMGKEILKRTINFANMLFKNEYHRGSIPNFLDILYPYAISESSMCIFFGEYNS